MQMLRSWQVQDFHLHTVYSDGSHTPLEILEQVVRYGIQTVAITDHESVRAFYTLDISSLPTNLDLHPGIELDCTWGEFEVHLLGFDFDIDHPRLQEYLNRIHRIRRREYTRLLEAINRELGEEFLTPETVFPSPVETWMKPHIFQRLGAHPRFRHLDSEERYRFFKSWMAEHNLQAQIPRLSLQEGIELIHEAHGYAVLAHPGYYWKHGLPFPQSLTEMKAMGLDGIEVVYPYFQPFAEEFPTEDDAIATVLAFFHWAREFRLLMTRGSDVHRPEHLAPRYAHLERVRQAVEAMAVLAVHEEPYLGGDEA